jgi:pimeloyl-ACP methyl ester carboxylesterase
MRAMSDAPLVALHGLGGDHRQFDGLLPEARELHCPDLPAHGASTFPEDLLTIGQFAAAVRPAIRTDEPPVLVGISMGAAVALDLVASGFDARGLVLVRPAWRWTPSPPNLAVYAEIADALDAGRSAADFATGAGYAAIARVSPAAAEALLGQFDQPHAVRRSRRLRALPASAPQRPKSVPPTLVLGCANDPVHPLSLARDVAADLGADFGEVPPRYDRPEEHRQAVSAAIARFVSEV